MPIGTLVIDYKWLFSTIAQSLAAMIGVGGMFIIYRLQFLESEISQAVRDLQKSLPDSYENVESFLLLSRDETIKIADSRILSLEQQINQLKKELEEYENNKKQGNPIDENLASRNKSRLDRESRAIIKIQAKKENLLSKEKYRDIVRGSALITIIYLIFIFFKSLLGLVNSDYLMSHPKPGNGPAISILILVAGGLVLFALCCMESLNLGRAAIIEFILRGWHAFCNLLKSKQNHKS
jgi:hypothetical protein